MEMDTEVTGTDGDGVRTDRDGWGMGQWWQQGQEPRGWLEMGIIYCPYAAFY